MKSRERVEMAPSHSVQLDTPLENIYTMVNNIVNTTYHSN